MKCPLRFKELVEVDAVDRWRGADCIRDYCAWWDETTNRCLWLNVNEELSFIHLELKEIREMIPQDK